MTPCRYIIVINLHFCLILPRNLDPYLSTAYFRAIQKIILTSNKEAFMFMLMVCWLIVPPNVRDLKVSFVHMISKDFWHSRRSAKFHQKALQLTSNSTFPSSGRYGVLFQSLIMSQAVGLILSAQSMSFVIIPLPLKAWIVQ